MVSIEKGVFIKPLSLLTLFVLVLASISPHTISVIVTFFFEWTITSTVTALAFTAYFLVPFRRHIDEEFQNPLHQLRTLSPKKIRILTYNLFLRPPLVKTNSSDHKEIRLAHFIDKVLPNFDIIALQEVFELGSSRQGRLVNAAKRCGLRYFCKSRPPKLWSPKWVDAGLLILSRYPIVETGAHIFRSGNQIDYYAAKQVLHAKIQITESSKSLFQRFNRLNDHLQSFSGRRHSEHRAIRDIPPMEEQFLHVFTTHMQASYNENDSSINDLNDRARLSQVVEMGEFVLDKVRGREDIALLAGDFNINARKSQNDSVTASAEYEYLMATLASIFKGRLVTDLLLQQYKHHPATFGDAKKDEKSGKLIPLETVLTHPIDLCIQQCIDYMISIQHPYDAGLMFEGTHVEEFLVDDPIVTQISDHYGVSSTLNVTK